MSRWICCGGDGGSADANSCFCLSRSMRRGRSAFQSAFGFRVLLSKDHYDDATEALFARPLSLRVAHFAEPAETSLGSGPHDWPFRRLLSRPFRQSIRTPTRGKVPKWDIEVETGESALFSTEGNVCMLDFVQVSTAIYWMGTNLRRGGGQAT